MKMNSAKKLLRMNKIRLLPTSSLKQTLTIARTITILTQIVNNLKKVEKKSRNLKRWSRRALKRSIGVRRRRVTTLSTNLSTLKLRRNNRTRLLKKMNAYRCKLNRRKVMPI